MKCHYWGFSALSSPILAKDLFLMDTMNILNEL
jgi:hypothetical protein